ncbi:hypothetical protein HO133_001908 [Letharia lupina]|uniref:Major facilitator superfamily (MFS) profile domain-containing protein n=1 Tax=Letharia lupina TaxID=560253 RepID=A0A8H6CE63_9LECA|nr:uncharacterized protein HO133_001908 [Letharia lupina]KAF6221940.1 hypothetical protein HO133_001908 [Letharia lupina]
MGKSEAMEVTEGTATPASLHMSERLVGGKLDAAEVTVTERTATPTSLQTSEGSLVEKALGAESMTYLRGWRLHFLSLSVALLFFLVNIEVSIVGTSLISITDDLHSFKQGGWVVTGYLITYTSMIIIWGKISDIFGRKQATLATTLIFIMFSAGCGASQTMTQLIVNRVFQGIGAAGCVSMALTIAYEMVPKSQYPSIAAQLATASALGSLAGPVIGGGVAEKATWRWVFLLNVPAGLVTIILLYLSVPANFPYQGQPFYVTPGFRQKISKASLARLDLSGAFLLLGATLLLVTVLLEAPNEFSWHSKTAIALFVLSGVLGLLFLLNERMVTGDGWRPEPIFPWRFLFNRAWIGTLILSLLSGIPYNIIVIDIPQRLQTVNGISPLGAGIRLVPFNFMIALGCILINVFAMRTRIAPIYLVFAGSIVQLIGLSLFSTLSSNDILTPAPSVIYGREVLSGFGIGMVWGMLLVIPPHVVEHRDLAISSGALLQFRVFGGALGLALASAVMNSYLTSHLSHSIGSEHLAAVLQSTEAIKSFPLDMQRLVLEKFAEGYDLQMKILAAFAGLQVLCVGLLWRGKGQGGQICVVLVEEKDLRQGKEDEAQKRERRGLGGWLGELVWKHFIELER